MNFYNGFTPNQRLKALAWLKRQYAAGTRTPPSSCDACGQTDGVIEPHDEDYSEPYGDHTGSIGVCYRCHMMIHCRFKNPDGWKQYRAAVRRGLRFEALRTRAFWKFCQQLRGVSVPVTQHEPPKVAVLDLIEAGYYVRHLNADKVRQSPERLVG